MTLVFNILLMHRHSAIEYPNTFWGHCFYLLNRESLNLGIVSDLFIEIKDSQQIKQSGNLSYYNLSLNEPGSNVVPIDCEFQNSHIHTNTYNLLLLLSFYTKYVLGFSHHMGVF